MIECTDKNIYYKKRRKSHKVFRAFLLLSIVAGLFFYYKYVVENFIVNVCYDYIENYSTEAVNTAVLEIIENDPYSELVRTEKNDGGDIVLITADSLKINVINKKIALRTQEILEKKFSEGINLPVLAFTGIKFLSGYGFPVNIKTVIVGSTECGFSDSFTSAGINQTMHSLFLTVNTSAKLNLPSYRKEKNCSTKVLLGEAVIVGKVPEIYLNA